jgi:sarcosine oxidase delta subunit
VLIKYLTSHNKPENAVVKEDGQVSTRWVHIMDRQRHFNIMRMKIPPDLTAEELVDNFNKTMEKAVFGN